MKKIFTLLLMLVALARQAHPATPAQQAVPPKATVVPKMAPAAASVKSQPNQSIYLTLASEAKAQPSTGTNYTLIAAIIAAVAAIVSALLGAIVALKGKQNDFKNDYYKKVIEKRIKAVEVAENLLGIFSVVTVIEEGNQLIFTFFVDNPFIEKDDKFKLATNELAPLTIWCSQESKKLLLEFIEKIVRLRKAAMEFSPGIEMAKIYLNAHQEIEAKKASVEASLSRDMETLYDVKGFFKAKRRATK